MKNYWTIMGGAMLGMGTMSLIDSKKMCEDEKVKSAENWGYYFLIFGTLVTAAGIYMDK